MEDKGGQNSNARAHIKFKSFELHCGMKLHSATYGVPNTIAHSGYKEMRPIFSRTNFAVSTITWQLLDLFA